MRLTIKELVKKALKKRWHSALSLNLEVWSRDGHTRMYEMAKSCEIVLKRRNKVLKKNGRTVHYQEFKIA